jgi:peptide/nickel transport system ATP-binding protein
MPSGCVFHTRCPRKLGAICEQQDPPFVEAGGTAGAPSSHQIRCHIPIATLRALQREPRDDHADGPADGGGSEDASRSAS